MNSCFRISVAVLSKNISLGVGIISSCLLIFQYSWIANASESTTNRTRISDHPVIIIVSYDGFRYDYMLKTDTPNLDQVKTEGVSAAYMLNQFPTKTFPNHHSIATGLHTESHGVTDNNVFDLKLNRTLGIQDEELYNFRDVIPLWTLNEWAGDGRVSGTMMWPGSNFPFGANRTLPVHVMNYNPSIPFETRVDVVLNWITNETHPANLVFMYFEEPDEHAHSFGPESDNVLTMIRRMDSLTGYMISQLRIFGIFERVNLILLSDHGFREMLEPNTINISSIVNTDLYDKYGSSPVFNINPVAGQLDQIYDAFLNASKTSNFSVYKRDELNKTKPHWFYQNNARIMPLILVSDAGYAFDDYVGENGTMAYYDKKFNVSHSAQRVYGIHGYDNNDIKMQPYFLAHGPLFRSGEVVEPFHNLDLFPLICQVLHIPEPPNNGSFSKIQVLLFRKGFHLRGTVGLAVVVSVILSISILLAIMYLMAYHRKRHHSLLSSSNVNYRFVNNRDESEEYLEETSKAEGNGILLTEVDEFQSLLKSSSNEEL